MASGGALTVQLLELLDKCAAELQRDIVKFLPEIVTAEYHAVRFCPHPVMPERSESNIVRDVLKNIENAVWFPGFPRPTML